MGFGPKFRHYRQRTLRSNIFIGICIEPRQTSIKTKLSDQNMPTNCKPAKIRNWLNLQEKRDKNITRAGHEGTFG